MERQKEDILDKRVIIVDRCEHCPYKTYYWKGGYPACSRLNYTQITRPESKLDKCPLEKLDVDKITKSIDKEDQLLTSTINYLLDKPKSHAVKLGQTTCKGCRFHIIQWGELGIGGDNYCLDAEQKLEDIKSQLKAIGDF